MYRGQFSRRARVIRFLALCFMQETPLPLPMANEIFVSSKDVPAVRTLRIV